MSRMLHFILPTLALGLGTTAWAQDKTWDGDAGDLLWFSDANWNPDGVPTASESALVNAGGIVRVEGDSLLVQSMDVLSGMSIGNSSIQVGGSSHIIGLLIQSCCAVNITANGPLLIDGASVFSQLPIFKGASTTTLGGSLLLGSGMLVDAGALVDISGTAAAVTVMTVRDAGRCSIVGTLTMDASASLRTVGTGQWTLDGGEIQRIGTSPNVDIQGNFVLNSGTLSADTGALSLTGAYAIQGGVLSVANGGTLDLRGAGNRTIKPTQITGSGRIDIRTGVADLGEVDSVVEASVTGADGLRLYNGINLLGDLENSQTLRVMGASIVTAAGARVLTTGTTYFDASPFIDADFIVRSGGRLIVASGTTLDSVIRVDASGMLELRASLQSLPVPSGAQLAINGLGVLPTGVNASFIDIQVPTAVDFGGVLRAEDGTLQLKGGAEFGNATIEINDTPATGSATVFVGGDSTDQISFPTSATIVGTGTDPVFILGNTFGGIQPGLTINGTLTTRVGNSGGGRFRMVHPDIQGSGEIINQGVLRFERTARFEPSLLNEGTLELQSAVTFDSPTEVVENRAGGVVQQSNTMKTAATIVRNNGFWFGHGGANILPKDAQTFGGVITNAGTMAFDNGSQTIDIKMNNNGTVIADSAFLTVTQAVDLQGPEPTLSGIWIARNGGKILMPQSPAKLVGPATRVEGDGTSTPWIKDIQSVEDGAKADLGDTDFSGDLALIDGASLLVDSEATCSTASLATTGGSSCQVEEGGTLDASGTATVGEPPVDPDGDVLDVIGGVIALARGLLPPPTIRTPLLHLYGRLVPMAGRIGTLAIDGDLLMEDSATLVIETAGLAMTDRADVSGTVTLAGRVSLDVLTGYAPIIGDEITVMTAAGGFTGAIAGVDPIAPGNVRWRAEVVGSELHLVATCQADYIAPFGVLDFFDVQAFLNFYSAGDLNADLNADGQLDFFDLQVFLNVYSGGCS